VHEQPYAGEMGSVSGRAFSTEAEPCPGSLLVLMA
jgi:hypothetical protein